MKKLSKNEWVAIVVALVIVGVFMVFPNVLKKFTKANGMPTIPDIQSPVNPADLPQ